jgi:hypothetical protein
MPRRLSHRQRDLFEPAEPPVPLGADARARLLPLVQALLAETVTTTRPASTMETGDDQDHA